ncbi:hypothetical protein [Buttiauxella sp. BIGb0552]|uniref:hypothetical protein n=1 Tax=Buttiauxella sp. BIGb0552 TaxID=2485120 RepID=UPI001064E32F|nr:hypothetical protein [Buttiauxella sp. BIGb0552]
MSVEAIGSNTVHRFIDFIFCNSPDLGSIFLGLGYKAEEKTAIDVVLSWDMVLVFMVKKTTFC